jgi:hypothetical protein
MTEDMTKGLPTREAGSVIQFPKRKANAEDITPTRADFETIEKLNAERHEKLAKERAEKNRKVLREFKIKWKEKVPSEAKAGMNVVNGGYSMTTIEGVQEFHRRRCELAAKAQQTLDKMSAYNLDELLRDMLDKETKFDIILDHAEMAELEEWANGRI